MEVKRIDEGQIVKLLSVTVTDILSNAGDLVEYHVSNVEHIINDEDVCVTFAVKDSTLPSTFQSMHKATFKLHELNSWIMDSEKYLTNVEFRLAEALRVREGNEE